MFHYNKSRKVIKQKILPSHQLGKQNQCHKWSGRKEEQQNIHRMLLQLLFLFATLAAASPSLSRCPYNRFGQYFIVYGPNPQKAGQATQQFNGMPHDLYPTACAMYEMRPANITSDIVPDLVSLIYQCQPSVTLKQGQPLIPGAWFSSYEGLPTPHDCNILYFDGTVGSSDYVCEFDNFLALCEVPTNAVEVITTTITNSVIVTEDVTSQLTTVFLSTETVTDYFVTRITTVITQGTSTLTTITTTSTSCSTITRTYTITPTCSDTSSSSSSSFSNSDCCPPNHHRRRDHHRRGCRDCGAKIKEPISDWKSTKIVKAPAVPNNVQQSYIQCTDSLNGFFLVREGLAPAGRKLSRAADINGVEACAFFSSTLANITMPILQNLGIMFDACLADTDYVVFNSYYGWNPLCGFVQYGVTGGVGMNDVSASICEMAGWALCHSGSPLVTTSTVTTGPFSTNTINIIRTETAVSTETVLITETITEDEIMTVTNTSYLPITSTISTTVTTNTVTLTSTSVTSCCCNPVVCTTIQECCKPKPTCHKPASPHHH